MFAVLAVSEGILLLCSRARLRDVSAERDLYRGRLIDCQLRGSKLLKDLHVLNDPQGQFRTATPVEALVSAMRSADPDIESSLCVA